MTIEEIQPETIGEIQDGKVVLDDIQLQGTEVDTVSDDGNDKPEGKDTAERPAIVSARKLVTEAFDMVESEYRKMLDEKEESIASIIKKRQADLEMSRRNAEATKDASKQREQDIRERHEKMMSGKDEEIRSLKNSMAGMEKKMRDLMSKVKEALDEEEE